MEAVAEVHKSTRGSGEKLKVRERLYVLPDFAELVPRAVMKNNPRLQVADLRKAKVIGKDAFLSCTGLHTVHLESLRKIDRRAFSGCVKLRQLRLPASVYLIAPQAFQDNKRLETVIFPKICGLRILESEVFSGCVGLREITLPGRLTDIGRRAFYKCVSLTECELPVMLQRIGEESFYQCGFAELELPEGLLEIGESAFLKCKNLEYVYVPDTVQKIGKWAFHGCNHLQVLEVNHDPEEIGEWITNKLCTIRCPKDSRMEAYARHYGMKVEYLPVQE